MANESRLRKSLLNVRVNLLFYFIGLLLSFFSRKIFLDTLGADFIGLTGAISNLMNFLNLAELGIGSAIGYVLYKPLFEHNEEKINEIISVFGYIYRQIGFIILSLGILLSCFFPLIFPDTQFSYGIIYFVFYSLLVSSLLGYFFNYKQTLLGADQKNYLVAAYFQTSILIKTLIQIAIAHYTGSYFLWIGCEIVLGVAYVFILNWKIKQVYPWLNSDINSGKVLLKKYPEVMKYTKQLFVHRIGGLVQFQTVPLLIYTFVSLKTVAFYGNYSIIIEKITQLITNLLGSTNAAVGNLIAEGDRKRIQQVFWELLSIRLFIAATISFVLFQLTSPFICLWLGKEYILPDYILGLIILNAFIGYTRGATDQFLYGYGLFHDTWAPITEASINLSVAVIGGYLWGLPGILLGGISSLVIIIWIWKPYFLYKQGFKISIVHYWAGYFKHVAVLVLIGALCYYFIPAERFTPEVSFMYWIRYGTILTLSYSVLALGALYFVSPGIRTFLNRFKSKFKR